MTAVDTWTGCVTVNGSEVTLPPKPHGVLVWLLVNLGRVVTEKELLEVVWRTNHAEDGSQVRNAISVLRTLLGFPGDSFIETVPGGGWRIPRSP
jgi:DNA-binding winged helix-turn-helix (wHTH) protein